MRFTERNADVFIYTFKDGALSALAHDLKLRVDQFTIDIDPLAEPAVHATFDPESLQVVSAREGGRDNASLLRHTMFGEIERNIEREVLKGRKITYSARTLTVDEKTKGVDGALTIGTTTKTVRVDVTRDAGFYVGRARIDQRDWGITPFTAMMGALKIKPHVEIEVRIPSW